MRNRILAIVALCIALAVVADQIWSCRNGLIEVVFADGYRFKIPTWTSRTEMLRQVDQHQEMARRAINALEPDVPAVEFRGPDGLTFVYAADYPTMLIENDLREIYPPDIASSIVQGKFAHGLAAKEVGELFDNTPEHIVRKAYADALMKSEEARHAVVQGEQ